MSQFALFYTKQIETDLEWREVELVILKKNLLSTKVGSTQEEVLLRTNLAMIYAHYEGFCKFALGVYIDALEKLALKPIDLKWPIGVQSLRQLQSEMKSIENPADFFAKFLTEFDSRISSPASYEKPDTIANLWPDLLTSWLSRFGLNSTVVNQEYTKLNNLVNNRNQIAHGKKLMVANRTQLDTHANAATLAMHEVAVGIIEALEQKKYERSGHVMTILRHALP